MIHKLDAVRIHRWPVLSSLPLVLSSCAWMSTYVAAPEVDIVKLSMPTARIVSANFWLDGGQLSLRGEVVPNPITKSPLRGHLDIKIDDPDRTGIVCTTTSTRLRPRHARKTYSVSFEGLPSPGSKVTVWHHAAKRHATCQSDASSTTSGQTGPNTFIA